MGKPDSKKGIQKESAEIPQSVRVKGSGARALLEAQGKPVWQDAFLASFRRIGVVSVACDEAGISHSTPYKYVERNPDCEFVQLWKEAELVAADVIEAEMHRRAVEGVEEFVVSHGRVVEHDGKPLKIRKYSDQLLIALAKARKPEKFSDKVKQEITTTGTGAQIAKDSNEVQSIVANLGAGLLSSLLGMGQPNKSKAKPEEKA